MSRKNKRLKALTESGRAPLPPRKNVYLTEEMDEVTQALVEQDIWDDQRRSATKAEMSGTASDELRAGYDGRGYGTALQPSQRTKPQINAALVMALLKMQGVVLGPVDDIFTLPHDITWVLAGNGVFQVRKTQYGIVCAKVEKVSIDTLPDWNPPAYHWPLPKMPWSVFAPAIAFLRWVKQTHNTEGLIRAYWNEADSHLPHAGWTIYVPEQRVTSVSVDVANTVEDPGFGMFALELHSHPGDSSVFSGTDDANEQRQRLFGCVAGLTSKPNPPNFHWRIGTGAELWADVPLDDIVSVDDTITFNLSALDCLKHTLVFDPFQSAVFPDEWKAKVTAPMQTASTGRYFTPHERQTQGLLSESDEDLVDRFKENEAKWYRDRGYTVPNGTNHTREWRKP